MRQLELLAISTKSTPIPNEPSAIAAIASHLSRFLFSVTGSNYVSPWMIIDRVRSGHLLFAPGMGWQYSNTGYLIVRQLRQSDGEPLRHKASGIADVVSWSRFLCRVSKPTGNRFAKRSGSERD